MKKSVLIGSGLILVAIVVGAISTQSHAASIRADYNQAMGNGDTAFSKHDYNTAAKDYQHAVSVSPTQVNKQAAQQKLDRADTIIEGLGFLQDANKSTMGIQDDIDAIQKAISDFTEASDTADKQSASELLNKKAQALIAERIPQIKKYETKHDWADAITAIQALQQYDKSPSLNVEITKDRAQKKEADFSNLMASAKKNWAAGKDSDALSNLQDAIALNPSTSETSAAKSLLNSYQQQEVKRQMALFTGGGPVQLAVANVELHSETSLHVAGSGMTFIYLYVGILNASNSIVQSNPLNLTLSTPDGYTASVDSDMFDLGNYLQATDLTYGQKTAGWVVFYIPKASSYTLTFQDLLNTTTKDVTP